MAQYFSLTRKYITTFGALFNDIFVIRSDENNKEVKNIQVPIDYGPKEKYIYRLKEYSDLNKPIQITLPRMSYEIKDIKYDAPRKQNSMLIGSSPNSGQKFNSQYMGVPYDLTFSLSIYTRNADDGYQIVEQILPRFTPDRTISIRPIATIPTARDVAVILNSVNQENDYASGEWDNTRSIIWTLDFTMKGWYWVPVSTRRIILKATANIWDDPKLSKSYVIRMNMTGETSNTFYGLDDVVYQGKDLSSATAYGKVIDWAANTVSLNTGNLWVGASQGIWKPGNPVKSSSTNADCVLVSFDTKPLITAQIVVVPDPIDAQANDDYGYTETLTEYPDTLNVPEVA